MRRTFVETAFITKERPTNVRHYTHAFVEFFVNSEVVINGKAMVFCRDVSYVLRIS